MRWTQWLALGAGSLVLLTGCASTKPKAVSRDKTLFERVGGRPYLTAIVDDFVVRVDAEPRLKRFFMPIDRQAFQARLLNQLCEASGGPCKAAGREAQNTLLGVGMTQADFDAMVEKFGITLEKFKVVDNDKRDLLALLSPLRREFVQR